MQKTVRIRNDQSELPKVNQLVEELCEEAGLGMDLVMKLQLVLEEAVSNVIFYAYDTLQEEAVEVSLRYEAGCVSIEVSDRGKPFDPTAKEDPDITLAAEDRPIGGLGIFLVKQIMDEVLYERRGEVNRLTMRKRIN